MLSRKQNAIYRPVVKAAWLKYCSDNGRDPKDKGLYETWYRKELLTACSYWTTKQITNAEELDAALSHFAVLANDDAMIKHVAASQERRAIWWLKQTIRNAGVSQAYVDGIQRNMGYGDGPVEDLPAENIRKITQAIFIYWKRQLKKEAATS